MKIEIPKPAKEYVLKHFSNVQLIERAFKDIGRFFKNENSFDKFDIQKKCSYLSSTQLDIIVDILTCYQDEDEWDFDMAFAVCNHLDGFCIIYGDRYDAITKEIYIQLTIKPNTFYGRHIT